ncbi:MAG: hypothetical protein DHS20C17_17110 [Cyclobacteriaceae bacterium]|nr:MAG: hypothetical protein DHS20C17_17110 [Cyclobacteriaceae bacterium]
MLGALSEARLKPDNGPVADKPTANLAELPTNSLRDILSEPFKLSVIVEFLKRHNNTFYQHFRISTAPMDLMIIIFYIEI